MQATQFYFRLTGVGRMMRGPWSRPFRALLNRILVLDFSTFVKLVQMI